MIEIVYKTFAEDSAAQLSSIFAFNTSFLAFVADSNIIECINLRNRSIKVKFYNKNLFILSILLFH
jgi:hypothetical protein